MNDSVDQHAPEAFTIDVVSDAVCPWCFVGKRRLEAALETIPDLPVEIRWRPFQLDGTIPAGGISRVQYLSRKFGPERAREIYGRLNAVGEEAGIPFAFDKIARSPNTLDAHRLIRWAQPMGKQDEIVEKLFNAYFIDGRDIGDHDTLAKIAGDCGMDASAIRGKLATAADLAEVREEIEVAQRIGVTGVPFFILGGKFAVAGAQSAEALAGAIQKAAQANTDNALLQDNAAGPFC